MTGGGLQNKKRRGEDKDTVSKRAIKSAGLLCRLRLGVKHPSRAQGPRVE